MVFRQDGVDRPVLDIYVRQGRLETPSDDPEEVPDDPTPIQPEIQSPKGTGIGNRVDELAGTDRVDTFWEKYGEQIVEGDESLASIPGFTVHAHETAEQRQQTSLESIASLILLGSLTVAGGALGTSGRKSPETQSQQIEELMDRLGRGDRKTREVWDRILSRK